MNLHLQFLLLTLAGWINRQQQDVVAYLQAENRALREQLGPKRIRWTDAQRRLLADKAKALGRAALSELGPVVTPDTLLRWYRKLVASKYDGSGRRGPGRPRGRQSIAELVVEMARSNPGWGYTRIRGALSAVAERLAAIRDDKSAVVRFVNSRTWVRVAGFSVDARGWLAPSRRACRPNVDQLGSQETARGCRAAGVL
jgi:hypothetical protein